MTRLMHCLLIATLASGVSVVSQAATTGGLSIKSLQQTPEGVLVAFKTTPAGCSSSYEGYHAILRTANPNLNTMMAVLVQKRALNQTVTIVYDAVAVCDKTETLLNLSEVK